MLLSSTPVEYPSGRDDSPTVGYLLSITNNISHRATTYELKNDKCLLLFLPSAGSISTGIYIGFALTSSELKVMFCTTNLFIPASIRRCDNVCCNIGDIFIRKTSAKSRHGILSVGDLGNNRLLGAATGKVLVKGLLLKSLLRHDHVLSSGVARSAVGVEDLFSGTDISGESWRSKAESDGAHGGSLKGWNEEYLGETKSEVSKLQHQTD